MKKRDRIQQELQADSEEDRKNKLEMLKSELDSVNSRISDNNHRFKGKGLH